MKKLDTVLAVLATVAVIGVLANAWDNHENKTATDTQRNPETAHAAPSEVAANEWGHWLSQFRLRSWFGASTMPWSAALAEARSQKRGVMLDAPSQQDLDQFKTEADEAKQAGGRQLVAMVRPVPVERQLHDLSGAAWSDAGDGNRYLALPVASHGAGSVSTVLQLQNEGGQNDYGNSSVLFTDKTGKVAEEIRLADLSDRSKIRYTVPVSGDQLNVVFKSPVGETPPKSLAVKVTQISHAPDDFVAARLSALRQNRLTTIYEMNDIKTDGADVVNTLANDGDPSAPVANRTNIYAACAKEKGQRSYSKAYQDAMDASVGIHISGKYFCSATIIKGPQGPALLTARHCVGDQAAASTVTYEFFARTTDCAGTGIDPRYKWMSGGGSYFDTPKGDISLMSVPNDVPIESRNISFAYLPDDQSSGVPLTQQTFISLAFPEVKPLSLFESTPWDYKPFTASTREAITLFFRVEDSKGVVLPGSSGGGMFQFRNGRYEVVGVTRGHTLRDPTKPNTIDNFEFFAFSIYPKAAYEAARASLAASLSLAQTKSQSVLVRVNTVDDAVTIKRNDTLVREVRSANSLISITPPTPDEQIRLQLDLYNSSNCDHSGMNTDVLVNGQIIKRYNNDWDNKGCGWIDGVNYVITGQAIEAAYSIESFDSDVASTSRFCLDDFRNGAPGTWSCHYANNQKWYFGSKDSNGYSQLCIKSTNKCLERSGSKVNLGGKDRNTCSGNSCRWKFDGLGRLVNKDAGPSYCVQSTRWNNVTMAACDSLKTTQQWQVIARPSD